MLLFMLFQAFLFLFCLIYALVEAKVSRKIIHSHRAFRLSRRTWSLRCVSFRPTFLPAAVIFAVTVAKSSMLHATPYLCNKRIIFALAMLCANYFMYCLHQCCLYFQISFLQQNIWYELFLDTLAELHRILYYTVRIRNIDLNVVCNFLINVGAHKLQLEK